MATPVTIISTLLFISLLTATAATTTTTTTTTITDVRTTTVVNSKCKYVNPGRINHCTMYLTPEPKNGHAMHLPECCGQLDELETKCRCMALKAVVWKLQNKKSKSGGSMWESEQLEQIEADAQDLPTTCNVKLKEPCIIVQALAKY